MVKIVNEKPKKRFKSESDAEFISKIRQKVSEKELGDKKIRTVIRLNDFNTTMSLFGIECIEKKERFVEFPHPRWQFGIVINSGIEKSIRYPKTDIEAWYEKEEYRDQKYEELLRCLESFGFRIVEI